MPKHVRNPDKNKMSMIESKQQSQVLHYAFIFNLFTLLWNVQFYHAYFIHLEYMDEIWYEHELAYSTSHGNSQ